MTPRRKKVLIGVLVAIPVAVFLTAGIVAADAVRAGMIHVSIHEKGPDGFRMGFKVPAAVVTGAMHFVPNDVRHDACGEAGEYLPLVNVLLREMSEIPNATLVEVVSGREHVRVVKEDGRIVVDVDTPGEAVHVSVPLRTVYRLIQQMEGWA